MLFVENNNTDPYCNHALEEWLMENRAEDCFMFWRNRKAVLLGKNQNVYGEINLPYAKERGIKIVRRITGGGAVYTDEGNIMFTFISGGGRRDFADFRKFAEPVLSALRALGIHAEFMGRNDMGIDGRKFSGNAQCMYGDKLLHHGTLMYSADTGEMEKLLTVGDLKLRSKGVASVKSRVTNISEYMSAPMDIEDFRAYLSDSVMKSVSDAHFLRLSEDDWDKIKKKAAEKHASPEWIYGHSPAFNIRKETRLTGGILQVYLNIIKGHIEGVKIYGDFFGDRDVSEIEMALHGSLYEAESLRVALSSLTVCEYVGASSPDELISALI